MTDEEIAKAYPLAGYSTHTLPGAHVLMHFLLVPNEQALQTEERLSIPVTMTAAQAAELADALQRAATAARMGQAPSTSRS